MKEHLLCLEEKAKRHARCVRNAFLKEKQGIVSVWRQQATNINVEKRATPMSTTQKALHALLHKRLRDFKSSVCC
jgi:hypothetical protein